MQQFDRNQVSLSASHDTIVRHAGRQAYSLYVTPQEPTRDSRLTAQAFQPSNRRNLFFRGTVDCMTPDQRDYGQHLLHRLFDRNTLVVPTSAHLCPHGCYECCVRKDCWNCVINHPETHALAMAQFALVQGHMNGVRRVVGGARHVHRHVPVVVHQDGRNRLEPDRNNLEFGATVRTLERKFRRQLPLESTRSLYDGQTIEQFCQMMEELDAQPDSLRPGHRHEGRATTMSLLHAQTGQQAVPRQLLRCQEVRSDQAV